MKTAISMVVIVAAALYGCSNVDDTGSPSRKDQSLSSGVAAPPSFVDAPAYVHDPTKSRWFIGGITGDYSSGNSRVRHIETTDGAASINLINQSYLTVLNAGSSRAVPADPIMDPEAHNAAVKAYFASLGFPMDQVGHVDITTIGMAEASSDRTAAPIHHHITYTSHLMRFVDGARVIESHAFASITMSGVIVGEGVYWPLIPASVRAAADALKKVYGQTLPQALQDAIDSQVGGASVASSSVAIHHSAAESFGEQTVYASWDVNMLPTTGMWRTISFDVNGAVIPPINGNPEARGSRSK